MSQEIVTAATADLIAKMGRKALEHDAGVVFKASQLAQIDEHMIFQAVRFEHVIDLGQIVQRVLRPRVINDLCGLIKNLRTAT